MLPHAISHVLQQNQPSKVKTPLLCPEVPLKAILLLNINTFVFQEVLLDLQETHVTCTESSSNLVGLHTAFIAKIQLFFFSQNESC